MDFALFKPTFAFKILLTLLLTQCSLAHNLTFLGRYQTTNFSATDYYASGISTVWGTALQDCAILFPLRNVSLLTIETAEESDFISGWLADHPNCWQVLDQWCCWRVRWMEMDGKLGSEFWWFYKMGGRSAGFWYGQAKGSVKFSKPGCSILGEWRWHDVNAVYLWGKVCY